jgi:hypothetical protein
VNVILQAFQTVQHARFIVDSFYGISYSFGISEAHAAVKNVHGAVFWSEFFMEQFFGTISGKRSRFKVARTTLNDSISIHENS